MIAGEAGRYNWVLRRTHYRIESKIIIKAWMTIVTAFCANGPRINALRLAGETRKRLKTPRVRSPIMLILRFF